LDKIFASLLILSNIYLLYISNFKQPYFIIAFIFLIMGIYFLFKMKKDDYEWYISSSIITLFCILSYI